mgnify:CR=1 FL=1
MEGVAMAFIRQTTEVDFGSTSIENIFINDFMPGAQGTYVKVYLMGYKYACDNDFGMKISNKMLSRHLSLPIEDVLGAWDFWESRGIIRKLPSDKNDATDFGIEFLSLRQLYVDNNFRSNTPLKRDSSSLSPQKPQNELQSGKETEDMFESIEEIVGRPVSVNEAIEISGYMDVYSMSPSMVVEAYTTASEKRGIHTSKYIGGILKNWYDKGVFSMKDLEARREEDTLLQHQYKRIFDALGFFGRSPSKAEKKAMDQWLVEWEFPIEMVMKACENTVYATKPSIKYIHSILAAWHKDGLKTMESLENHKPAKKAKPSGSNKRSGNKFHNFKQAPPDYSEDELKKILKEINNLK